MDLLQVTGQPDRREGALAELPDDLVLAVVEDIAEMDGMVTARVVVTHSQGEVMVLNLRSWSSGPLDGGVGGEALMSVMGLWKEI